MVDSATASHECAGSFIGQLPGEHHGTSRDQCRHVAAGPLNQTGGAGRQVVHQLRGFQTDVVEIDHVQVRLAPRLDDAFLQDTPDHRILRTTLALQQEQAPRPVILVSKDTNLRMKAKSLGLRAQDYTSDKVQGFDKLYTGRRTVEGIASEVIDEL